MDRVEPAPGGRVIAAIKERGHLGWPRWSDPPLGVGQRKLRVIYEGGHNLPAPRFAGVFIIPIDGGQRAAAPVATERNRSMSHALAASSDHRGAVEALIAGLTGSGKPLLHTSGSSAISPWASLQIKSFMRAGQSSRNLPRPLV